MDKRKTGKKRSKRKLLGIENDRPAELSRENRHDLDRERVTNQAPLSNEGREIV